MKLSAPFTRAGLAVARRLGADPAELVPLARALSRDLAWRQQEAMTKGHVGADAARVLIAMLLGMGGLGLGVAALVRRDEPVAAAALVLATVGLVILMLLLWELYHALLGDEDYRVIAAWPVDSRSFLLARLVAPLRDAVAAALLLAGPAALALAFADPPVLPGLALLAVAVLLAVGATFLVAALYVSLLRHVGVRVLRLGGSLLPLVAGLSFGAFMSRLGPWSRAAAELPAVSPTTWLLAPVAVAAGALQPRVLGLAALGTAVLLLLPLATFRWVSARHADGRVRTVRGRQRGRLGHAAVELYGRLTRRPTDRVIARLALAHLRGDWRFQSQLVAMVVLIAYLAWSAARGQSNLSNLFTDPRSLEGMFHPGMMLFWIAAMPALFAVSLLSVSSDPEGAWFLRLGPFTEGEYAAATRRLTWAFLLLPLFAVLALGYAVAGAPAHSAAAYLVLLCLASDLSLILLQRAWSPLPFSLDQREAQSHLRLLAYGLVAMFVVPVLALALFHLAFRWWAGYAAVLAMLAAARWLASRGLQEAAA